MQEILERLERIEALLAQAPKEYVDTEGAAVFLGLQTNTLEIWRSKAEGPTFIRVGRKVMYSLADLRQWMEERKQRPLL